MHSGEEKHSKRSTKLFNRSETLIQENGEAKCSFNRRSFLTAAGTVIGSGFLASVPRSTAGQERTAVPYGGAGTVAEPYYARRDKSSHLKLSQRVFSNASEDYMLYMRQLGLKHVDVVARRDDYKDAETLKNIVSRFRENGFEVGNINPLGLGRENTMLGKDGREEEIRREAQFIKDAGAAGFQSILTGWRPSGLSRLYNELSHREKLARGAETPVYHYDPEKVQDLVYDRRYGADELWENFDYWSRRIMPVAEDADIPLAVHPGLGIPEMGGVAHLFSSRAGYEQAIEIADSPFFGITFCVGPWASNPELYGDPAEAARDFSERNRIFHVHFRNVSSPLPSFHETFLDEGYVDMHRVMKGLFEGGFDGTIIPDHSPQFINDRVASGGVGIGAGIGLAYHTAYMRAIIRGIENDWRPHES